MAQEVRNSGSGEGARLAWAHRCLASALIVTALVALSTPARAADPSDLDLSFDGDGTVQLNFAHTAEGVAVQDDGKIVVVGSTSSAPSQSAFAVARLNPDGSPDTSFSGDGMLTTDFGNAAQAQAVALQSDGDIVVAGGALSSTTSWDFGVAVYNPNGSLDTGFSTNGLRVVDFDNSFDFARTVAVQGDNKIVVGGEANLGGDTDFGVARLTTSGSLDATFSGNGQASTGFGEFEFLEDLTIQADGKIVAVGWGLQGGDFDFLMARYTTSGGPDLAFNNIGRVETPMGGDDFAMGVAMQADGKIVVGGTQRDSNEDHDYALARYTSGGGLDSTFDGDGKLTTEAPGNDSVADVAVQSNGRILAVGGSDALANLRRYTSGGDPDSTFGFSGFRSVNLGGGSDFATSVALQDNGKIVIAGREDSGFALARLHATTDPPPNTIFDSGPSGTTADATPTFAFHSSEAGSTFQCRVDTGTFQPCTSPRTLATLPDGAHTFEVRSIDSSAQPDPSPAERSFTVDTTPNTNITSGPGGPTADTTPTFGFTSSEAGSTFECAVDTGAFAPCTSPHTTEALVEGPHTFLVRATDSDGVHHTDPTPAERAFSIDVTPPDTVIDSAPTGVITQSAATFEFHGTEPGSLLCRLDTAAFQPCTSPRTVGSLADGPHVFQVAARDAVGNVDQSPAQASFVVDTAPPDTVLDSGPGPWTRNPRPTFGFHSSEAASTFECATDAGAFAVCPAPYTVPTALSNGQHVFRVRAVDVVGHVDPTPATRVFTVDTVPPDTAITRGPQGTITRRTVRFSFTTLGEAPFRFSCRLDARPWRTCTSPKEYRALALGRHVFRVRAIDRAGNIDPRPASRIFRIVRR